MFCREAIYLVGLTVDALPFGVVCQKYFPCVPFYFQSVTQEQQKPKQTTPHNSEEKAASHPLIYHKMTAIETNNLNRRDSVTSSTMLTPRTELLNDLDISLETVYDDPKGRIMFKKYLKQSKNTESLLFLEAVEDYGRLRSSQNRYKQVKKIVDTYVKVNSKHELNLAASVRGSLLKKSQNVSSGTCPADLFEDCVNHVLIQMKEDLWPRFIKTTQFQRYMEGRVKEMREADGIGMEMMTLCGFDVTTPFFTSRDFNRIKEWVLGDFMEGAKWNLATKKKEYSVYLSEKGITADALSDRKIKSWKIAGTVNIPLDILTRILISTPLRIQNDGNLRKVTPLDFIFNSGSDYACAVTYEKYYMGGFIADREYVLSQSFCTEIYDTQKNLRRHILARKTVNHENAPEQKKGGPIRCDAIGSFFLEEIDANTTRYYEVGWIDLKGSLPLWLWNRLISSRGGAYHKGIKKGYAEWKVAQEQNKLDELRYTDSAGMLATLDYYESALKKKMNHSSSFSPSFPIEPKEAERIGSIRLCSNTDTSDDDLNTLDDIDIASTSTDFTERVSIDPNSNLQYFVF
jgi:hypothetical protein